MGSININYIRKPDVTKKGHLYSDLSLDLEIDHRTDGNFDKATTKKLDLKVAYDEFAILNSLKGLFSTEIGERLLLPEYGLNIKRILFEPISNINAQIIGTMIKEGIERWEPRVIVNEIIIKPEIDDQTYYITLDLYSPMLAKPIRLTSELVMGQGFKYN